MRPEPKKTPAKPKPPKEILSTASPKSLVQGPAKLLPVLALLGLAFLFYGNTLSLQYALDDTMVITGNQFTKNGLEGIGDILSYDLFAGYFGKDQNMVAGGRYRPLSLVTFALEIELFGENPLVSHLINVILLWIIALLIKSVLLMLFRARNPVQTQVFQWWWSVPFLTAALFIAHPVHTEVVANIKGRDEILSLLFSLLAMRAVIIYFQNRKKSQMGLASLFFFLGLMAKENTLTFLAVIPLALYFFCRLEPKNLLVSMVPLGFASLLFFLIRQSVIGNVESPLADDLMNNPFVEMTFLQKYATILYTLGIYLKLLVFPHPLTYDYYPYHIPIIQPWEVKAILPLAIYLAITVWAFWSLRRKHVYGFSILFFLVTLSITSNVFFPIGVFMNERFLFMSSLGFCLALAWFIVTDLPKWITVPRTYGMVAGSLVIIILVAAAGKTWSRNADWYDSTTLFLKDVEVSSNSAKGNAVAGEYLIYEAKKAQDKGLRDSLLQKAIAYEEKAISIYPKQIVALFNLAAAHYEYNRNYEMILEVYKKILGYLPGNPKVYENFLAILAQSDETDRKINLLSDLLAINPERGDVNLVLGTLWINKKQDHQRAFPYLQAAARLLPGSFDARINLGVALAYRNLWAEAKIEFLAAEGIKPGDPLVLKNLAAASSQLGQTEEMARYLELARKSQSQVSK